LFGFLYGTIYTLLEGDEMKFCHEKMLLVLLLAFTCALFCEHGFAEAIKPRNKVTNLITGHVLAEYREWIYTKEKESTQWKKIIPGRCPQWFSDGKKFFYFLDVGYDGYRAELWSADANGEARLRLTRSDYWIRKSPVVSSDGRKLAYHYSTCRASGDFDDIVVIDLSKSDLDEKADAKVVLRTKEYTKFESLKWIEENKLQVIADGKTIGIDTSVGGKEQLP
jgi:hypothetical protein